MKIRLMKLIFHLYMPTGVGQKTTPGLCRYLSKFYMLLYKGKPKNTSKEHEKLVFTDSQYNLDY